METAVIPWPVFNSSGASAPQQLLGAVFFRQRQIWDAEVLRQIRSHPFPRPSASASQRLTLASDGMRRSPRGERATLPTFGPSGRQERLNCWEKNLL